MTPRVQPVAGECRSSVFDKKVSALWVLVLPLSPRLRSISCINTVFSLCTYFPWSSCSAGKNIWFTVLTQRLDTSSCSASPVWKREVVVLRLYYRPFLGKSHLHLSLRSNGLSQEVAPRARLSRDTVLGALAIPRLYCCRLLRICPQWFAREFHVYTIFLRLERVRCVTVHPELLLLHQKTVQICGWMHMKGPERGEGSCGDVLGFRFIASV